MGYEVAVTPASRDGGVDVEARRNDPAGRALILIQCKRYESVIRVPAIRELMGVVARRQANKGILIATCGFTSPARQEASEDAMIELIDFAALNGLLNQYFGAKWPDHISYKIRQFQMNNAKTLSILRR
jgi:restriction system protein